MTDIRDHAATDVRPRWRWLFLAPGLAAVGYGGWGVVTAGSRVPLDSWAVWLVGSALLNDVVLIPAWVLLGWIGSRTLPDAARGPAAVGAAVSGALALVATPVVLGFGRDPANTSFLPRDYGSTLALLIGGVVVLTVVWTVVAVAVGRRRRTG